MVDIGAVVILIVIVAIVIGIVLFRRPFFIIIKEAAIAFIVYLAVLILLGLIGIYLPSDLEAIFAPITIIVFIVIHFIMSQSDPTSGYNPN